METINQVMKSLEVTGRERSIPVGRAKKTGLSIHLSPEQSKAWRALRELDVYGVAYTMEFDVLTGMITLLPNGAVQRGTILPDKMHRGYLAQVAQEVVWPKGRAVVRYYDPKTEMVEIAVARGAQRFPADILQPSWKKPNKELKLRAVDTTKPTRFAGAGREAWFNQNPGPHARSLVLGELFELQDKPIELHVCVPKLTKFSMWPVASSPNGVKSATAVYSCRNFSFSKLLDQLFDSAELRVYALALLAQVEGLSVLKVGEDIQADEILFASEKSVEEMRDQDLVADHLADHLGLVPKLGNATAFQHRTLGLSNSGPFFSKGTTVISKERVLRVCEIEGADPERIKYIVSPETIKGRNTFKAEDGAEIRIGMLNIPNRWLNSSIVPLTPLWLSAGARRAREINNPKLNKHINKLESCLGALVKKTRLRLVEAAAGKVDAEQAAISCARHMIDGPATYGHFDDEDNALDAELLRTTIVAEILALSGQRGLDKLFVDSAGPKMRRIIRGLTLRAKLGMAMHHPIVRALEEQIFFKKPNRAAVVMNTADWCEEFNKSLGDALELRSLVVDVVSPEVAGKHKKTCVADIMDIVPKGSLNRAPARTHENIVPCVVLPALALGIETPPFCLTTSNESALLLDGDFDGDYYSIVTRGPIVGAVWAFGALRDACDLFAPALPFTEEEVKEAGLEKTIPYVCSTKNVTPPERLGHLMSKLAVHAGGGTTDNLGLFTAGVAKALIMGDWGLARILAQAMQVDVQGLKKVTVGMYDELGGLDGKWLKEFKEINAAAAEHNLQFWSLISAGGRFGNTAQDIPLESDLIHDIPQGQVLYGLCDKLQGIAVLAENSHGNKVQEIRDDFLSWVGTKTYCAGLSLGRPPAGMVRWMANVRKMRRLNSGTGYQAGIYNKVYAEFLRQTLVWCEPFVGEKVTQYGRRLVQFVAHVYQTSVKMDRRVDTPEMLIALLIEARLRHAGGDWSSDFSDKAKSMLHEAVARSTDFNDARKRKIAKAIGQVEGKEQPNTTIGSILERINLPAPGSHDAIALVSVNMFIGSSRDPLALRSVRARSHASLFIDECRSELESVLDGNGPIFVWRGDLVAQEIMERITHLHSRVVIYGGKGSRNFGSRGGAYKDMLKITKRGVVMLNGSYTPSGDTFHGDILMRDEKTTLVKSNFRAKQEERWV